MEQGQLLTSARKKGKSKSGKELKVEYKQIEGTPFTIMSKQNKHVLLIGNNRISEETNDINKLIELIEKRDYHVLGALITSVTMAIIEMQNNKQTGNK